jgi:hypothetical protein
MKQYYVTSGVPPRGFLKSDNFLYYQECVINIVGKKDWEDNTGMYVNRYKDYLQYANGYELLKEEVAAAKTNILESKYSDKGPTENRAAKLNTFLTTGLKTLQKTSNKLEIKDKKLSVGHCPFSTNSIECFPGYATEKFIFVPKITVLHNSKGDTIQLKTTGLNKTYAIPNNISMFIFWELILMYMQQGCDQFGIVSFSLAELLERLKWSKSGAEYERLKMHLYMLRYAEITSDDVYRFKKNGEIKKIPGDKSYTLLSDIEMTQEKDDQGQPYKVIVSINRFDAASFQEKYYLLIDIKCLNILEGLELWIWLFLYKRKGKDNLSGKLILDINDLCERVGMVTSIEKKKKYNLKKACEKFVKLSLIKNFTFNNNELIIIFNDANKEIKALISN